MTARGRIGIESAMLLCVGWLACGGTDVDVNERSPDAWVEMLKDQDPAARLRAAHAIVKLGPRAAAGADVLIKTIEGGTGELRAVAVEALREAAPQRAVDFWGKRLEESSEVVMKEAASELGKLGESAKSQSGALERGAAENTGFVRRAMLSALDRVDPQAASRARDLLKGQPPQLGDEQVLDLPGGARISMLWIPGGAFRMGCSPGDTECAFDELPPHPVTVSAFWMSQYEVTQGQWESLMGTKPWEDAEGCLRGGSEKAEPSQPVYCVSWDEARQFTQKAGQGLRLPTEAEWEYAARAGTQTARYGAPDDIAWYKGNSGAHTHAVGQKSPNAWGLHDMLGNVWEWTGDWYGKFGAAAETNPTGAVSGTFRVDRGGSWGEHAGYARASFRGGLVPRTRGVYLGFRVARGGG